jgi:hypothetical protein
MLVQLAEDSPPHTNVISRIAMFFGYELPIMLFTFTNELIVAIFQAPTRPPVPTNYQFVYNVSRPCKARYTKSSAHPDHEAIGQESSVSER